jgi:hypothetical protein
MHGKQRLRLLSCAQFQFQSNSSPIVLSGPLCTCFFFLQDIHTNFDSLRFSGCAFLVAKE